MKYCVKIHSHRKVPTTDPAYLLNDLEELDSLGDDLGATPFLEVKTLEG